MIATETLIAVSTFLDLEADMLVEKARVMGELFGPATVVACAERAELFRGYAAELLAEAKTRAVKENEPKPIPDGWEVCECGKACTVIRPF